MRLPGMVQKILTVLSVLFVLATIGATLLFWRLSSGPVSLDFLTRQIEDALSPEGSPYDVSLSDLILTWGQNGRPIDILASDLRITRDGEGIVATAPSLSLTFSLKALVRGIVAPKSLILHAPRLHLLRLPGNKFRPGLTPYVETATHSESPLMLLGLTAPLGLDDTRTPYLTHVAVENAEIVLEDTRKKNIWRITGANTEISRSMRSLKAFSSFTLHHSGQEVGLKLLSLHDFATEQTEATVSFDDLSPAGFEALFPALKAINMPLAGKISATFKAHDLADGFSQEDIRNLTYQLTGSQGTLHFAAPIDQSYTLASLSLKGHAEPGLKKLHIDRAVLETKEAPKAELSLSFVPADAFWQNGDLTDSLLYVSSYIQHMPLNALGRYWPETIGEHAYDWVTKNLSDGQVDSARYELAFKGMEGGKLSVEELTGTADVSGVTVRYLPQHPVVKNASGSVDFEKNRVDVSLSGGSLEDLSIHKGTLAFMGLGESVGMARIALVVDGPLSDALTVADYPPYHYAAALGLKPKKLSGGVRTTLSFGFPLTGDLSAEQIQLSVKANIRNGRFPKAFMGKNVTDGALSVTLDKQGMDVTGTAKIADIPIDLQWRENFGKTDKERRRYSVRASLDEKARATLGMDRPPFTAPFMSGTVVADAHISLDDTKSGFIGLKADLTDTTLFLPGLRYEKQAGQIASSTVSARIDQENLSEISRMTVTAGDDLSLRAKLDLKEDGSIDALHFETFIVGRTDIGMDMNFLETGGIAAKVFGKQLDLNKLIDETNWKDQAVETEATDRIPLTVQFNVEKAYLSEDGYLNAVHGQLNQTPSGWEKAVLRGQTVNNKPVSASFMPDPKQPGNSSFKANSGDAGGMMKAFGIIKTMKDGTLSLSGTLSADKKAKAKVSIEKFNIVDAPLFAKLLNVASLTGILDALRGKGIAFDELKAPISYEKGILTLEESRMTGSAIGLTAGGNIDLKEDKIDVKGTIIPAYAINSLPGKIPLVGKLFSGEDGGGMFAATYQIEGAPEEPTITVNPLSALAPGIFRSILTGNMPDKKPIPEGEKQVPAVMPEQLDDN